MELKGTHDLIEVEELTLVKDLNPKYKVIELISAIDVFPYARVIGKFYFKDVKKKYGDKEVVSIMNFNDTRTTSIAIKL